jgi:hypothetical protein
MEIGDLLYDGQVIGWIVDKNSLGYYQVEFPNKSKGWYHAEAVNLLQDAFRSQFPDR